MKSRQRDSRYTMTLDQDRQAAMMRAEGHSFRQIAEALSISDKTAKGAVERFRSTARAEEQAAQKRLAEFEVWLDEGRKRGWLGCVLAAVGRDDG